MPKRFMFLCVMLFLPALLFSQPGRLNIEKSGEQLFLKHTVTSGENFYSVGRLYNVSPRDLAAFNRLSLDKGLTVGQALKIPLSNENFGQSTVRDAAEALVPVYHRVAGGETLFRIGLNYNNVPLDLLKKWNNLSTDNVNKGADMIVGFLRVNRSESALARQEYKATDNVNSSVTGSSGMPRQAKPEVRQVETAGSVAPVVSEQPNSATPATTPAPTPVVRTSGSAAGQSHSGSGFFKAEYDQSTGNLRQGQVSGSAAVFKSTSGWQDGKYYCFNNDAQPGSIVQIEVPGTQKVIYAKVLDAIPDIRQNEGLTVVLSNAAANALGMTDEKFDVQIRFYK